MKEANKDLLRKHLEKIAGERTPYLSDQHLKEVANYLKETFQNLGYPTESDSFTFQGETFENVIARKKGLKSEAKIIIGAHFDSVPGTPGADDNASGVAAMLELARILADHPWNHTAEFIGFNIEEWNMIGSSDYVNRLKHNHISVHGMISLEMVGFATDVPRSQKMPAGFGFFYPSVGNFIGVVGNIRSWKFMNEFKASMKETEGLGVESLLMPFNGLFLPATRWSDHSPFWDAGYPALLITDTSFYRNPHYHGPTDAIETLNLDFMQKVTQALAQALIHLDNS
ncbi:MAG: M28 family peptidase [Candidatus Omnitrophica bacterium]|nr:M28 family peptidase [Candidatus Omnitrophota bacterium]